MKQKKLLYWIKISCNYSHTYQKGIRYKIPHKIIIGKCKRSSAAPYLVWRIIYYERNLAIYDIIQVNIFQLLASEILSANGIARISELCVNEIHPKFYKLRFVFMFRWYFVGIVSLIGSAYKSAYQKWGGQHSPLNCKHLLVFTFLCHYYSIRYIRQSMFMWSISGTYLCLVHASW